MTYSVTVDELYEGYPDYWDGHGHTFTDKSVKACMVVAIPINYTETVGELVDGLVSEANQEWEFLEETTQAEIDGIEDQITDAEIRDAIKRYIGFNLEDSEQAFTEIDAEIEEDQELPEIILVLHVWREDQ